MSSNNSFTLPTPPAHRAKQDSAFRTQPPREIPPVTDSRSVRTFLVAFVLVLCTIAGLSFAGTASAATKCGQQVLLDWYDNGRIDKLYPLNCYEEGIDAIPNDIEAYSDAAEVITRALQGALHGNLSEGGCDPSTDGSADDCARQAGGGSGGSGGSDGGSGDGSTDDPGQVAPDVDTSSASSVPIPLLVLGGMSILLLGAGGLGYLSRRRHAADADDLGGDDPLP